MKFNLMFLFFAVMSALPLSSCRPSGNGSAAGNAKNAAAGSVNEAEAVSDEQSGDNGTGTTVVIGDIKPASPMTIKVYVENSGSMQGYVSGGEFNDAVHGFLSDIYISKLAEKTEYNFINDKIIPQGSGLDEFFAKFTPSEFNYGSSDISRMLKMILDKGDENTVSIFISDCIFSPGRGVDAAEYLNREHDEIKTIWADKSGEVPGLAASVFRKSAMFSGKYFNRLDNPKRIKEERPYFIWMLGPVADLAVLRYAIPDSRLKADNAFSIVPETDVKYSVMPGSGSFKPKGTNVVSKLRKKKTQPYQGTFAFAIGAEMTALQFLLGESYIEDSANYSIAAESTNGDKCRFEVRQARQSQQYSHFLWLSAPNVFSGKVRIALNAVMPKWVEEVSDRDGLDVDAAPDKTFGFSSLVNGIYDAALRQGQYAVFTVNVE